MKNCSEHGPFAGVGDCPHCNPLLCKNCGERVAHAPVDYIDDTRFTFVVWHAETGMMGCDLKAELPDGYIPQTEDEDDE